MKTERIEIIDSHTAGEPTRVVVSGGPNLGGGSLAQRRSRLTGEFDRYRAAIVCEPRGSDVIVGAWLVAPTDGSCATGVIFFNNVGGIGMCGHGTIGVVATLAHLGRIRPGQHRIETPVGVVSAHLADDGSVTVENVVSHRAATGVRVEVPDIGTVTGDVAWGGNWFFLTGDADLVLDLAHVGSLTERAWRIRNALNALGHPDVDHVELFGAAVDPRADARSFVLCPGKAYDRSPCGTGTSAKLACLAADGSLAEGASWMQESVIGSTFTASYRWQDRGRGTIVPSITGRAFVTVEASLVLDAHDPYRFGIQPV